MIRGRVKQGMVLLDDPDALPAKRQFSTHALPCRPTCRRNWKKRSFEIFANAASGWSSCAVMRAMAKRLCLPAPCAGTGFRPASVLGADIRGTSPERAEGGMNWMARHRGRAGRPTSFLTSSSLLSSTRRRARTSSICWRSTTDHCWNRSEDSKNVTAAKRRPRLSSMSCFSRKRQGPSHLFDSSA